MSVVPSAHTCQVAAARLGGMEVVGADPEEQFVLRLPPDLAKRVQGALKAGRKAPRIEITAVARDGALQARPGLKPGMLSL